jgi:hypothetical protein
LAKHAFPVVLEVVRQASKGRGGESNDVSTWCGKQMTWLAVVWENGTDYIVLYDSTTHPFGISFF